MKNVISKIINSLKQDKKIAIGVATVLVLFIYQASKDFFTLPDNGEYKSIDRGIDVKKLQNVSKEDATFKISESQVQREYLALEEREIREEKFDDKNASYQRKKVDLSDNVYATIDYKEGEDTIRNSQNKITNPVTEILAEKIEIPIAPKIDFDALEGGTSLDKNNNNGKVVSGIKTEIAIKEETNNTILENDNNLKIIKNKRSIYDLTNGEQVIASEEEFNNNLNLIISSVPQYVNHGGSFVSNAPVNSGNNNGNNGEILIEAPTLNIKPGSSYVAKLLTPLNNLYSAQIKPILDIQSGDLKNYRAVGEVEYQESTEGIIIAIHTLVDDNNVKYPVNGFALKYDGDEMAPTFADEIDRHLIGRVGFGALSVLANDYSGSITTNVANGLTKQALGDATKSNASSVLGSTFSDLAQQYKTEVKVNPKMMYLIFY